MEADCENPVVAFEVGLGLPGVLEPVVASVIDELELDLVPGPGFGLPAAVSELEIVVVTAAAGAEAEMAYATDQAMGHSSRLSLLQS